MITNVRNLPPRDQYAEVSLLNCLVKAGIHFAILQRDWTSKTHGDIDIVLDTDDWSAFVDTILKYSSHHNHPIVKAYEIEFGVICVVMITGSGTVYLDTAISGARRKIFGLDLISALNQSEVVDGIPVLSQADFTLYTSFKRSFKKSRSRPLLKKLRNLAVIFRRFKECTLMNRGALLYIPYLNDEDLLLGKQVRNKTNHYFNITLRNRYSRYSA